MMKSAEEWMIEIAKAGMKVMNSDSGEAMITVIEAIRAEQREECAGVCIEPLKRALSGCSEYRYDHDSGSSYIRWGKVERDMKRAILKAGKDGE